MTTTTRPTVTTDLQGVPYTSQRSPVMAVNGVVATSQPLAAQAGLSMLQQGGSAVDAALATAIALTVLEPCSNGIGGDVFSLVWDGSKLHGINGSGRAPAATTPQAVRAAGHAEMPNRGWWPITVPGAPRAWADLHARFGKLPFAKLFEPAVQYARYGYFVSPIIARAWNTAATKTYAGLTAPEFAGWFETFAPNGRHPGAGERWSSEGHASTLEEIGVTGSKSFYEGALAEKIAAFSKATGGPMTVDDLAAHTSTWVEPIRTTYRGYEVAEIPPNGQGIAALIGLNIAEGFDLGSLPRESLEAYHLQIEALKLSLTDAQAYVADMDHVQVPVSGLLDKEYASQRGSLIGQRAITPTAGKPKAGGTVYLCAADADGMMVSYIQSNYQGFGSGVVVPGAGISLHNRGYGFTLADGHPNQLAPRKRPYHTIIPGFLLKEGEAVGPFGVMGGFMQAQGHMQMVINTVDYGMNPQASLDAPRWRWDGGMTVAVEPETSPEIVAGLRGRGHDVQVMSDGSYGRGQIIWKLPGGGYVAGSDKRADGCAAAY
ncbi:MAG: gamma-glutamyltransferase family protein [Chloroflexi bacterium]|nr:gamma-glutamyltransferase family protein [Chloroflexota bacterium]